MATYKVMVELADGSRVLYSEDLRDFETKEHYEDAKLDYPCDDVIILEEKCIG